MFKYNYRKEVNMEALNTFSQSLSSLDMTFILGLVVIFIIKVVDNMLGTSKTILTQKNKAFLAALTVVVSQVIFYKLIDAVASAEGDLTMYVVAVASGVGTYIAIKINEKLSKERTFVNVILSDNKEAMEEFVNFLRENKITNLVTDAYTKDWGKTIAITAYAETKAQSRLLDKFILESENKFKRVITKQ